MSKISQHYRKLAEAVSLTCPALANFYFNKSKSSNKTEVDKKYIFKRCSFCSNTFSPRNSSVRLLPKPALNCKIKKLKTRLNTDPASLGKFQTKLVHEYVNGKNTVVISCHVCKKRRKLAGQTRVERHYQKDQQKMLAGLMEASEEIKIPSSKDKKKERRKLMKKKRAAGETDEEINAGLIIPETARSKRAETLMDDGAGQIEQGREKHDIQTSEVTYVESSKERQHAGSNIGTFNRQFDSLTSDKTVISSDRIHGTILNTAKLSQKPAKLQTTEKPWMALPQRAGDKKPSKKKNKSKKMSQQLGNILKKEQKKKTEGTLADFLSSL